jgi:hypothetical protein
MKPVSVDLGLSVLTESMGLMASGEMGRIAKTEISVTAMAMEKVLKSFIVIVLLVITWR